MHSSRYLLILAGLVSGGMALAQQTAVVPSVTGGTGITGGATNTGLTSGIGGGLANSPLANSATAQDAAAANAPPSISGYSIADLGTTSTSLLSPSNFLAPFYANAYYAGRSGSNGSTVAPGGFGASLYGAAVGGSTLTTTGTTGVGGASLFNQTGRTTGVGGATTGAGAFGATAGGLGRTGAGAAGFGQTGLGQTGFGQTGGFGQTNQNSTQVTQSPRQISYTATLKFAAPTTTAPAMQVKLRDILNSSVRVTGSENVQIITDGTAVVLRGEVASRDQAQLVEGMIRLTPGVRVVQNELIYPE